MKKRAKSKTVVHELKADQPLTARQKREIQALIAMPEEKIDTSEIPELPPGAWKKAVRDKWYRPVKQAVSIRLDADVLAWLRAKGDGYQSKVNGPRRKRMLEAISIVRSTALDSGGSSYLLHSQIEPLSQKEP